MKIRAIVRAAMLIILGISVLSGLTACGANASSSSGGSATTLSFWIRTSQAAQAQILIKSYNASHKVQIKLNQIPDASFVQKFGTAVAAGDSPDIISSDLVYLPAYTSANQLTDITDLAQKLPFFDKLSPSHIRLATRDSKLYALPFTADGSFLLYNKKLFKQAGLDPNKPPTTWAEIEADSQKITALGNGIKGYYFAGRCPGCNAFTFLPYIWASGGDVLGADGKTATMNSATVKDALTFYRRLWAENQVPQGAKVDNGANFLNAFTTDKIGMAGSGSFSIATLKQQFPKIDFGVARLPGKNGGTGSFAGGDAIGIPRGSKHVQEAFDFIKWSLSPDVQVKVFAKGGALSVRTDLAENEYSKLDPRYIIAAKAMAEGRTPYSVRYNELFNDANGPWISAFEKAIFDGQVDAATNTAQQSFTQILTSQS